jgi:hypothetical protein
VILSGPMPFLPHRDPRPLRLECPAGIQPGGLYLGNGAQALEVAVLTATRPATRPELRALHQERTGKRATPVVLVVLHGDGRAGLAGPAGGDITVAEDLDALQVERICDAALAAADRHSAFRLLGAALGQLDAPIPGLHNSGLFALHELEAGVPKRPDWAAATGKARPALGARGRKLIEAIGFMIEETPGPEVILLAQRTKVALALFLERADEIEAASPRFDGVSPITRGLAKAHDENLDYVVVAAGSSLRVYPVKPSVGTGRRGRTETYVELNLDLLRTDHAAYLWLLCSADALTAGGSFGEILASSGDFAAKLGTRLRERVYADVVPLLARAIVRARHLRDPSAERLHETYEMALLVLFRLLFVAYAEDKDLLPLHLNAEYRRHSLKELAKTLAEARVNGTPFAEADFLWMGVKQLWTAVNDGYPPWGVPKYNGGLFAADEGAGAALEKVSLTDAEFAPALAGLLLERTDEGVEGPIDFRSLGVREFGTIYEGLLESALSVAEADLAVDQKTAAYVPAKGKATVEVTAGTVYLHNASGARKSSGAYYTKEFAVEHLLEKALEPALKDHLARVSALYDPREASAAFFEFHVADIAMGSGHFLVAAIDRIEAQFSNYLAKRPLPGVADELERLRASALDALGRDWLGEPIEDTRLLRRQIARRCIFGVDINPLAVELARLSIWIHTFVPGLPLSFLDGNLVIGNSLVGVATFEEATDLIGAQSGDLFAFAAAERLHKARGPMEKLARLAEATAAEVKEAKKLYADARANIRGEENLLTVLAASRIDDTVAKAVAGGQVATRLAEQGDVFSDALVRKAEKALAGLDVLHFPIVFPQVFLGKRGGFDVIIGNPPWEKAQVEEHEFWARHYPGFRGTTQAEREALLPKLKRSRPDLVAAFESERERTDALRAVLMRGPYPGMGSGHPDLYKAFCWRFWNLVSRNGGYIGVVLPRAVFAAKGSEEFRRALFGDEGATDLTTLVNNHGWVFGEVHPQFSIGLVVLRRGGGEEKTQLALRGPYASRPAFEAARAREPARFPYRTVRDWTESLAVPLIPDDLAATVFAKLRRSPRFDVAGGDLWSARPLQGDLNASLGRPMMDFEAAPSKARWPVIGGEGFDTWTPDTGKYYAVADSKRVCSHLEERRAASAKQKNGAFFEFPPDVIEDPDTLACRHARIAFRDVSRATDSRTVRACLVPPQLFLVHNAPFLLWPRGDRSDEAYLLGVMCSLPFDWYSRRFVETHLTFDLLNGFPVPAAPREAPLRRRLVDCASRLAAQDVRLAVWAKPLGIKPRKLAEDEQADIVAELDAAVAHLYGLAEADLVHIFETFHEGWEYSRRLEAVRRHFLRLSEFR